MDISARIDFTRSLTMLCFIFGLVCLFCECLTFIPSPAKRLRNCRGDRFKVLLVALICFAGTWFAKSAYGIQHENNEANAHLVAARPNTTVECHPLDAGTILNYLRETLDGPPATNSPQAMAEILEIHRWADIRTKQDIERIESEENALNLHLVFRSLLGGSFNETNLPNTFRFLQCTESNVYRVVGQAKRVAQWKRLRPFQQDRSLVTLLGEEGFRTNDLAKNNSYPSGHAAIGACLGRILARLLPEHRKEILDRARLIEEDRIIAGVHFRSDVDAGRRIGDFIADELLKDPATLESLQQELTSATNHFAGAGP